jgi:hypothetical protein
MSRLSGLTPTYAEGILQGSPLDLWEKRLGLENEVKHPEVSAIFLIVNSLVFRNYIALLESVNNTFCPIKTGGDFSELPNKVIRLFFCVLETLLRFVQRNMVAFEI